MPTANPVTRFGRGFHGFTPAPRVTNFGPYEGDPNAPKGSTRYNLWRDGYYDSRGNPHRPGDIALTPDLARKYRYGDIVTEGGVTGRFTDVTNSRLTNRVDVWQAGGGKQPATTPTKRVMPTPEPALPQSPGMDNDPGLFASNQRPSVEITSPGPQRPSVEITPRTEPTPGRSATLTTDTNDDWIGAERTSPALIANLDAGTEAVSPTLSGNTLGSLPNERYQAEARPSSPVFADEWWKSSDSGTGLTADAGDIWGESSIFGSADTATGQSWDTLTAGGTEEGSHVFDFISDDSQPTTVAEAGSPLIEEPQPVYSPPQSEEIIPDTMYEDNLLAEDEQAPFAQRYTLGHEPVPSRNLIPGMDTGARPMTNLFAFGSPPPASVFSEGAESGETRFGGQPQGLQPGEATIERGSSVTGSNTFNASGIIGSQGSVQTGYGPMGVLDYAGTRVSDPSTQWTKDPQLGWVPKAQQAPKGLENLLNPKQYAQATFGGLTPTGYRDIKGSATGDSRAANLGLMAWVARGDNPNDPGRNSDEGQSIFLNGVYGLDESGQAIRTGERNSGYRRTTQKLIAGRTVNGRPWATGGGG